VLQRPQYAVLVTVTNASAPQHRTPRRSRGACRRSVDKVAYVESDREFDLTLGFEL
jgi:hypothetical protein